MTSMAQTEGVIASIPQGTLRGKKEISLYNDIYYSFQGIPYAKPPVGELRFKAPQPADGWSGIRDATKPGATAPCIDMFTGTGGVAKSCDEDCLFLNVYTKDVSKPEKKYPVMVWIHGGGFTSGSGNKDIYSPDFLMSRDVVIVSMNYRLGALGFISLQTLECPGNYGLKDIRLALQWVQNNISHFGGDPDNVTVFGQSAGGSAVHYLLLSPSCKGLFKRAISQSGSAYNYWAYARKPRERAYLLGKRLGCDATNDEELLNFLQKAPVGDLTIKSAGIIFQFEKLQPGEKTLNFSFVPTSEPESEESFITRDPLSEGFQLDVPYITGVTKKEILMVLFNPKDVPQLKEDKDFQNLIPKTLNLEEDSELSIQVARKIREFYFKDGMNINSIVDIMSDIFFNHGVHQAERRRTKNPNIKSPTYLYLFSFEGMSSPIKRLMSAILGVPNNIRGSTHAEEISYMFLSNMVRLPKFEQGTFEYKTMRRLVDFWVNFATTGKPTNEESEIDWRPTEFSRDFYLDIGKNLKLRNGLFEERVRFWDEIFKLAGHEE